MFRASAEFDDLTYPAFKDSGEIARVLRACNPRCSTVLDAACGTGEHARRVQPGPPAET